jgi:hypothetical protein
MPTNHQTISGLSRGKRFVFTVVLITVSVILSLWAADMVIYKVGRYQTAKYPDYPQAVRQKGMGPGGLLKEGFEDHVHKTTFMTAMANQFAGKTMPRAFGMIEILQNNRHPVFCGYYL